MTNFSDVRVGPAQAPFSPQVSNATGGMPVTGNSASLKGMVLSPQFKYQISPTTSISNALVAFATFSSASTWTQLTLAAGAGVTTASIGGVTYYDMTTERAILATGSGVSSVALLLTVSGLDYNYQAVTTTWSGPTGTATTSSPKTMRFVRGAAIGPGNSVSSIGLGSADVFGFPYTVINWGDVAITWTDKITASTGFTSADTTSPATSATGATRGKYAVQTASDGAKKLTVYITPVDVTTVSGLYGTTPQV